MLSRRTILAGFLAAVVTPVEAAEIAAAVPSGRDLDRLWIRRNDPGGLEIDIRFRLPGSRALDHDAVRRLSWAWRDLRDHDRAVWIDPRLFDLLSWLQQAATALAGCRLPFALLSGYRTPERNRTLEGAARNSMHIHGRAADLTLAGFSPVQLAVLAEAAGGRHGLAGGIGLYQGFTHLDTGRVRGWLGRGIGGRTS